MDSSSSIMLAIHPAYLTLLDLIVVISYIFGYANVYSFSFYTNASSVSHYFSIDTRSLLALSSQTSSLVFVPYQVSLPCKILEFCKLNYFEFGEEKQSDKKN
jgi:hypothetical protein